MRLFLIPLMLFAGCIACGFNSNLPNCHADDIKKFDDDTAAVTINVPIQEWKDKIYSLQQQRDAIDLQISNIQDKLNKAAQAGVASAQGHL